MNLEQAIDRYNDLRHWASSLARRSADIVWHEGDYLKHVIYYDDITLENHTEGLNCSGTAWTLTTGGSHEHFDFTILWEAIPEDLRGE